MMAPTFHVEVARHDGVAQWNMDEVLGARRDLDDRCYLHDNVRDNAPKHRCRGRANTRHTGAGRTSAG
jgi:hypothetical protein